VVEAELQNLVHRSLQLPLRPVTICSMRCWLHLRHSIEQGSFSCYVACSKSAGYKSIPYFSSGMLFMVVLYMLTYYIQGKLQAKETEVRYSMMRGRGRTTARGGPRERTQIAHTREGSEPRPSGPGYEEREGEVKEGAWAVVGRRALPRRGVRAASEEP
jgi:hypothetical protein